MSQRLIKSVGQDFQVDLDDLLGQSDLSFLIEANHSVYYYDFLTEGQCRRFHSKSMGNPKISGSSRAVRIDEATSKEIVNRADLKRRELSKKLKSRYLGINHKYGWIQFQTNSQFIPTRKYTQLIEIAEANDIKYFREFRPRDIIRLFLSGSLRVWCSCPDFKYRFKFLSKQMGFGIFDERRPAKIRNPNLEGSVCKHLIFVLSIFKLQWMRIAHDFQHSRFFKSKFYDAEDRDLKRSKKGS